MEFTYRFASDDESAWMRGHATRISEMQTFLRDLGFGAALPLELAEAAKTMPLWPPKWSEISTMTEVSRLAGRGIQ